MNPTHFKIANFVLFQSLWFAAVLGAANDVMLYAYVNIALLWLLNLTFAPVKRSHEVSIHVIAIVIGFSLDSLWVQTGLLSFSHPSPWTMLAPLWIVILWSGFAATLNGSLQWIAAKPIVAGAASFVLSQISYFSAERLGAVVIAENRFLSLALIGLSWAIVVPTLIVINRRLGERSADPAALSN